MKSSVVMKFFIRIFLVLGLLVQSVYAQEEVAAQGVTEDESQYFSLVNETGSYINQELHDAFWKIMAAKYDEKQQAKIVAEIVDVLDILKEFQIQAWKSANESYYAKRVMRTPGYEIAKQNFLKKPASYFSHQAIIESAEKIISAAANRSSLDLGNGKIYITPELIEENMIGIRGSYERLKLLITPQWQESYNEYVLPKINISLLSLYAPDEYHEVITQGDEKIDIQLAQLKTSKESIYEIGAVDYQKGEKKFADFTLDEKEIYIQEFVKEQFAGFKVHDPLLSKGTWRGYPYAKGVATVDDYSIIVMSLFVNDKALYIKYLTTINLSMAGADFNEFTKRIQILEKL